MRAKPRIPSLDCVEHLGAATISCLHSTKKKKKKGKKVFCRLGRKYFKSVRLLCISWLLSHTAKLVRKCNLIGSEEVIEIMPLLIPKTNTIPPNFSLSTEKTKAVLGGYRIKEAYQQVSVK